MGNLYAKQEKQAIADELKNIRPDRSGLWLMRLWVIN
jgi:hypothetical protein